MLALSVGCLCHIKEIISELDVLYKPVFYTFFLKHNCINHSFFFLQNFLPLINLAFYYG
jgi:hypothetical protein